MSIPNRIALLNSDGTTDASFALTYGLDAAGRCIQVNSDGQVFPGGDFTQVDAQGRSRLASISQLGVISADKADTNDSVKTMILQADGKLIVGGAFTTVEGSTRNRLVRLSSDLVVEEAYNPSFDGPVNALAQQEDGETLVGGSFATVSAVARANIARLYNDAAFATLTVANVSLVQWLRGGSMQEVQRVSFEEPAGTPIAGVITRIVGGWQFVPTTPLSGTGTITARAYPTDSHSEGILEDTVAYNVNPEIQITVDGTVLVDAVSTVTYADLQAGSTFSKEFTITNIGLATLTLTPPVTLTGANANQWSIATQPTASIPAGESVTFSVAFVPTSAGAKVAVLTVVSDDADEATFTVNFAGTAIPGPGGDDTTWQPVFNTNTYSVALSKAGEIWIGGEFTTVNSLPRGRYARLRQVGDPSSSDLVLPQTGTGAAGGGVRCFCHLADGRCLIGGAFTTVNGVSRPKLARLNSDGSLDASFNVTVNGAIQGFILEANGDVIVMGSFTTIGGVARAGIARLIGTSVSATFVVTGVSGAWYGGYAQTDGKIVLYGATAINALRRVNSNGSTDATFAPVVAGGSGVDCAVGTNDGKIVIGGTYTTLAGVSHTGVNRLSALGARDATFTEIVTAALSMQMQCDGRVVIGAYAAGGIAATERLTRALTTGANDATFIATARNQVYGLASQEDGNIIVVGGFTLAGSANKYAARVINDTGGATTALSIVSPTQVQWLRSGTSVETQVVNFSLSQDSGVTWTDLGQGIRISNGWELTGISLPISGTVRGQAVVQCGINNNSVTLHEDQVTFSGLAVGDLNIEYPVGTTIADNGSTTFPDTLAGQTSDRTFTLRNTGLGTVTGISATIPTSDWSVISSPATSLDANQTTTCTVRFAPTVVGYRGPVVMNVASSVAGTKNPYLISLNGAGVAVPLATTGSQSAPATGQRTLNGTFRANASTADAYFQYKLASSSTWIDTTPPTVISGFTNVAASKTIIGLTVGQSYNWRAICYNAVNAGQAPASPFVGATATFTAT